MVMWCAALSRGSYLWTRTDDCPGHYGPWGGRSDSLEVSWTAWASAASPPTLTTGRAGLAAIISHVGPIIVDRPSKCSPAECTPLAEACLVWCG